jgi:hypothetical protein
MVRRLAAVVVLALACAAPALAGDVHVSFPIAAGTLHAAAAPAALGGTVQVPVTVVDARGNGRGWRLRVAAAGSPIVTAIAVRCAGGSTCTLPAARVALPRAIGASATDVYGAAARSGLGRVVITLTVSGGHGPLAVSVVPR